MRKFVNKLLAIALFTTILALTIEYVPQVKATGTVIIVPDTTSLANAVLYANSGDRIHVTAIYGLIPNGYPLPGDLVITQPNVWIIGQPPATPGGVMPTINLNGHSIVVEATGVFIWGLNITDTGAASPDTGYGIGLLATSGCKVMNCTITGNTNTVTDSSGIFIGGGSWNNLVALNTINNWQCGINVSNCMLNNVQGNTLDSYSYGIDVNTFASSNKICWNNLMSMSTDPNVYALKDDCDVGYPNHFNDSGRGNYEAYWLSTVGTGNFLVPGQNNDRDYYPLTSAWSRKLGDFNLDSVVNLQDLVILANGYGVMNMTQTQNSYRYDPRADIAPPFGQSGLADLVLFALNFTNRI